MPSVLVADAGPLFSLAAAGALHILDPYAVRLTDVVVEETAARARLPGASPEALTIAEYVDSRPDIEVVPTTVGRLLAQGTPPQRPRNLGELSIQSLLIEMRNTEPDLGVVLVFEDQWFERNAVHLPRTVRLVSTAALVYAAERQGDIPDARPVIAAIKAARPSWKENVRDQPVRASGQPRKPQQ